MSKKRKLIIYNLPVYEKTIIEYVSKKECNFRGNTILFALKDSKLNNRSFKKWSIYLSKAEEKTNFSGVGILFRLPKGSKKIDIFGHFLPLHNNDTNKDKLYCSHHTLYFTNNIFRKRDKENAKKLLKVGALSNHLKAEFVELLKKGSLIPPHSHGYNPTKTTNFIQKWGNLFGIKNESHIGKNMQHPQIIVVLNGKGNIYLDDQSFHIQEGDVVIYGANTVHGTIAEPSGLKFIHLGWSYNEI